MPREILYGMSVVVLTLDDAVHALEAAVITLTGLNAIAAASVLVLIWLDNRSHTTKGTTLSRKLRLPFYLAMAILLSQIIFIIREALEFGAVNNNETQSCTVMSEFTWFGNRSCSLNQLTSKQSGFQLSQSLYGPVRQSAVFCSKYRFHR